MSQKIHPKGFRLISTQKHLSSWYSTKKFYNLFSKEDFIIRQLIEHSFKDLLLISNINIARINTFLSKKSSINIKITALLPKFNEFYKTLLDKELKIIGNNFPFSQDELQNFLISFFNKKLILINTLIEEKLKTKCFLQFNFLDSIYEDSSLIAQNIGLQLERRISFRRIIKQILAKVELLKYKGIKLQVSGRLNGVEIARREWKRYGNIPLHTLKANIDYTYHSIKTKDGIIGIKVWLLKD